MRDNEARLLREEQTGPRCLAPPANNGEIIASSTYKVRAEAHNRLVVSNFT